jgi:hypothetical protein
MAVAAVAVAAAAAAEKCKRRGAETAGDFFQVEGNFSLSF